MNVIFISTDHLRYDNIAANGNPHIITPTLDRLASEGVSLDQFYIQGPICMPSRASIWTGRYPRNHGVTCNGIPLPKSEVTMAHAFAQNGYHTANIGKLHFLPHKGRDHTLNHVLYAGYGYEFNEISEAPGCYPDAYLKWVEQHGPQYLDAVRYRLPEAQIVRGPFDSWAFAAPEAYHQTAWVSQRTQDFLRQYDDSRPFFLSVGFFYPHPPLNPPREFLEMYDPPSLPLPYQHPADMENSSHRDITEEQWRAMKAAFYALCTHIDHHVGHILDTLEATGLAKNTVVVFTSDHGDMLGDHGQVAKGPSNYDEIIHVPCIIRAPDQLPQNRRVSGMVESIDLYPTLAALCDVQVEPGVNGQNMLSLLRGETETGRPDILVEFKDPRTGVALETLRTDQYKYFHYNDGREVLYDLNEKPAEVFDRSDEPTYNEPLDQLRKRLLTRLIASQDDLPLRTADW